MSSALGILHWSPDTFWRATFYEYTAAMRGHLVSQGAEIEGGMTRNEFLALKAKDEQAKAP